MKQEAIRFGPGQEMLGILASPDRGSRFGTLILLIWNAGISHRIGPHRMNFDISEAMTRIGLPVFRFDVSGRGDSLARRDQGASAVVDVREAMNMLEARGYRAFILHGLCSGAIEAHYAAYADLRVVGLSMVDTYAYRVGSYYIRYLAKRILNIGAWKRLLKKMKPRVQGARLNEGDNFFVPFPPLDRIRSDFLSFKERHLKCHIAYSGGYDYVYNYPEQFYDMLNGIALRDMVLLSHYPRADHLFTLLEHRQELIEDLAVWIIETFPSSPDSSRLSDKSTVDLAKE